MLWSAAARRGLRCNPDRQILPANDARKVLRARAFARKVSLELDQRLWKPALRPRHGITLLISRVTILRPMFSFCVQYFDGPDVRAQATNGIKKPLSRSSRYGNGELADRHRTAGKLFV